MQTYPNYYFCVKSMLNEFLKLKKTRRYISIWINGF